MPMQFVNGINLYYDDHGQGDSVLLLTGLGGVGRGWGDQIDRFSADYRTIVPDHRGTGRTDRPLDGYTIENLAVDMADLIRIHNTGQLLAGSRRLLSTSVHRT